MDKKTVLIVDDEKDIRLTPTEFKILNLLMVNKGMVFSTEKIYDKIWGEEDFDVNNTVMVHIRNLRDKIESNNKKPQYIKTVWGVGYKFGE
ncbi:winged helix-turn-helix domain-containing protein [Inconstantimicrobium porci]|uniref:Winged helix-turn-helix domain-containing protein n=1 Tax=Inconstantimicrobium porci TaxID=2652291 RepID=A0A7X2N0C0_9CLOT|nr:helix-turn-helix domain-containing protein [Inconstantimicrobium porci]MSR91880.1 winged helix-turn-helix domain-containing protein [Inconstantimicrobium porci]